MPIRSYRCPVQHETAILIKGDYPDHIDCDTCGLPASYTLGAPAPARVTGTATPLRPGPGHADGYTTTYESPTFIVREKGKGLTHADYSCPNAHTWGDDYEDIPPVSPDCLTCGLPSHPIVTGLPSIDWVTMRGPYFDQGLGRWITSKRHREEVMRELGVREYDESEHLAAQTEQIIKDAAEDDEVRSMVQSMESGEDAAAMKTARDQGQVQDWAWAAEDLGVGRG